MGKKKPATASALRLDTANEWVWRGERALKLTPKAFAVLRHLAKHPNRLVTKEELLGAAWPDTVVGDAALATCIREIRRVLGDQAGRPWLIETVHRRGYRLIGSLILESPPPGSSELQAEAPRRQDRGREPTERSALRSAVAIVGREAELGRLRAWWESALRAERRIVFVGGEPGIGKTTLVDAFLAGIADRDAWVGQGQCIQHFGAGEAYLPVLAALGQLCRESQGQRLIELLAQHAPMWLVQMPALLSQSELETLQQKTVGATRERMLREIAEALEALTAERPMVLVLEDLHWSDGATLDLLSFLARRRQPARLLVLGTYRQVELILRNHPLKAVRQELQLHGLCEEIALGSLDEAAVGDYLAARFAIGTDQALPLRELARMIHRRTEGNALFMVNVANDLVAREGIVEVEGRWTVRGEAAELVAAVPESLRQMIEKEVERLTPEEQRVLEVGSVAGAEFSAAAAAAALEEDLGQIEARCGGLALRDQFLSARGTAEWPDGTVAARYGFVHSLYRDAVYQRVTAGRRPELHQGIGERAEAAYGDKAIEIAAELALHFEQGRDYRRAVQFLRHAAETALRRNAHQEAIRHLTAALELLKALPDTPERAKQELLVQTALGVSLTVTRGYAAPDVGKAYSRALELCRQAGETRELFPALAGLFGFYFLSRQLQTALTLGQRLLSLAEREDDPVLLLEAHHMLAVLSFHFGELTSARDHFERVAALCGSQPHRSRTPHHFAHDPEVMSLAYRSLTLWYLGYPDQALTKSREAVTLAAQLSQPYSEALALDIGAWVHQHRREPQAARERVEAELALAHEHGFWHSLAFAGVLRGWALVEQGQGVEGIEQMRQGLAALQIMRGPYFPGLLAEGHGKTGQVEEGLGVLAEALRAMNDTGERYYEAELYRLKGELLLQSKARGPKSEVPEECFRQAIDVARRQGAKSFELRAVMSLARQRRSQGKKKDAGRMLSEIYGWFTEGFDTADLQEAKALLEELRGLDGK